MPETPNRRAYRKEFACPEPRRRCAPVRCYECGKPFGSRRRHVHASRGRVSIVLCVRCADEAGAC